jgi:NADH-quinone oxidoreductase subunit G/NADP-reducing hydrogenase subunit HndD
VIEIEVNNQKVEAEQGDTILEACQRAGIKVPTLCHLEGLPASGACRICVVEVEGRPTLVPSCAFPVTPGMRIRTHSQRAVNARQTIIELLLANHPDDCLYCIRNGNCRLQGLAEELGVRQRRYVGIKDEYRLDISSPSVVRDPSKCILCGRCVRVCEEVQDVAAIDFVNRGSKATVGTAFNEGLNVSSCVNCGQCIKVCPTGALAEKTYIREVLAALEDPEIVVVAQHAPAVSVTLGELFGLEPGADIDGVMVGALRTLGFDYVFDTSFTADLTIMEETSELIDRIKTGGTLPMLTSCSPGWVKFVEEFYPEFLPNVSTCKSPQQMMGAVIKRFWAERMGLDPQKVFSVSIMPCTAKKFEADRPEMAPEGLADVDAVLTTRELAQLIRQRGLDMTAVRPDTADTPFGERSSAGKIFGATGGVMEAALRTAHFMLTGNELGDLTIPPLRGLNGRKEARVQVGSAEVGVAVVSGLVSARKLLDELRNGRKDLHFIEVMACPGGCISGGGQPIDVPPEAVRQRMQALYRIDEGATLRTSHTNSSVLRLYEEFLGEPLGHKSHELLHTHYAPREEVVR